MLFNSLVFVAFLAVVLLAYPRLRHRRQNYFLLVASYVFYGYWDWRFLSLLAISTLTDFLVGRRLHATEDVGARKRLLAVSVCVNLGLLGFFKYFNFFVDSMGTIIEGFGMEPHMPLLRVLLPIGISFYTFQTLSYTIDVYRRRLVPTDDLLDFAVFVSFFPQLVAGPIERARNLLPQVAAPRTVTRRHVETGLNLILLGFFKKIFVADTLAPFVNQVFDDPGAWTSGQLLTGVYAFCFQIYGDFSGYSDIARGVARLLGFELMENFHAPYLSRSPAEYWKRWHVSLSTWLGDYLYIPLGGNRKGTVRTYVNLMVTMLLGGLWHGASWTFVAWGLWNGLYLAAYRLTGGGKVDLRWPSAFGPVAWNVVKVLATFHLIAVAKILFRAQDFGTAWQVITGIVAGEGLLTLGAAHVFLVIAVTVALDIVQTRTGNHTWIADARPPLKFVLGNAMLALVLAAAVYRVYSNPPFIYFQF
ncbi:MBOAT family protein [bacterium]|nr:MBOAT family protein [bacterium]MBU1074276.1 MBOAT family protein [bacterium]MBU1675776.1 MBOAT family protein [bacterium]